MPSNRALTLLVGLLLLLSGAHVQAAPCLIFVHGLQPNDATYTTFSAARNYWKKLASDGTGTDFIAEATAGPSVIARYGHALSYYVIGYDGSQPWYTDHAAGEVSRELIRATTGQYDGGAYDNNSATSAHKCAQTGADGGSFVVIAHSMGNIIMDFILGNNDSSDPYYNFSGGRFDLATKYVQKVISIAGPHRGSQGADATCGDNNASLTCYAVSYPARWWFGAPSCTDAVKYLRTYYENQVSTYSSRPARLVYLTSGYQNTAQAGCFSGEDDGAVQYASAFNCQDATAGYNNKTVCDHNHKASGFTNFRNLDGADEKHQSEVNDSDRDERRAVNDGFWTWSNGSLVPGDTIVRTQTDGMSTAQFVEILY